MVWNRESENRISVLARPRLGNPERAIIGEVHDVLEPTSRAVQLEVIVRALKAGSSNRIAWGNARRIRLRDGRSDCPK